MICYTKEENRVIAVLIKEGELANEINVVNDSIISSLNITLSDYKKLTDLMSSKISALELRNKVLLYNEQTALIENDKLTSSLKSWKLSTFISSISSVGLLVILILL